MAEESGGTVGKLWKKHGGGYYALWAVGGYLVWAFLLSWLLSRREQEMRRELGLD